MTRSRFTFVLLTFFIVFQWARSATAQSGDSDSSFRNAAIANAIAQYHASTGDQSGLYNGAFYPGYPFRFKSGTAFFNSDDPQPGAVLYDGIAYNNLQLRFDDLRQSVMINDNGYEIQLNNKKLSRFVIGGHIFIHPDSNDINIASTGHGFYEQIAEGSIPVFRKTVKTIQEDLSNGQSVERNILLRDYYFIRKDGVIHLVEGKADLLDLFAEKKKDLQQFIRKNKLNFNRDKENAILRTTAYYELIRD